MLLRRQNNSLRISLLHLCTCSSQMDGFFSPSRFLCFPLTCLDSRFWPCFSWTRGSEHRIVRSRSPSTSEKTVSIKQHSHDYPIEEWWENVVGRSWKLHFYVFWEKCKMKWSCKPLFWWRLGDRKHCAHAYHSACTPRLTNFAHDP